MAVSGDVTDEAQVLGYLRTVTDTWGRLDIVVNNAAILGGRGVLDESTEFFDRAVRVAALGNFLNTKYAGRYMAEHGIRGSIVAISSSNGWSGSAGVIAYAFHKGGVNNFVRAAAMDLAPYGIRVNSFTPTAPTPDNRELIAERGAGGVLDRPPRGWPGRGGRHRVVASTGPLDGSTGADGADGQHRDTDRHRALRGVDVFGLCPADHRLRLRRRRWGPSQELRLPARSPADLAGPVAVVPLDLAGEEDPEIP